MFTHLFQKSTVGHLWVNSLVDAEDEEASNILGRHNVRILGEGEKLLVMAHGFGTNQQVPVTVMGHGYTWRRNEHDSSPFPTPKLPIVSVSVRRPCIEHHSMCTARPQCDWGFGVGFRSGAVCSTSST